MYREVIQGCVRCSSASELSNTGTGFLSRSLRLRQSTLSRTIWTHSGPRIWAFEATACRPIILQVQVQVRKRQRRTRPAVNKFENFYTHCRVRLQELWNFRSLELSLPNKNYFYLHDQLVVFQRKVYNLFVYILIHPVRMLLDNP